MKIPFAGQLRTTALACLVALSLLACGDGDDSASANPSTTTDAGSDRDTTTDAPPDGATSQVDAPDGSDSGSDALPPTTDTASVNDFSRDLTIFGAGNVQRPVGADIPHSGSTDAPDGATIEVRYVAADTLSEVHPWQAVSTAQDGQWSGVRNIPRTPGWLLAEARVRGSTAQVSRQSTRFAAGIIIFHEDQSNTHQGLKSALDGVKKDNGGVIPVTIGNEPGDFQLLWRGDGGDEQLPIVFIHDGHKHTTSVASMAQTFQQAAPGIKVLYAFDTLSGSSPNSPLYDGTGNQGAFERDFAPSKHLADTIHADGAKVDGYWADHFQGTNGAITWLLGAYLGRDAQDQRRTELLFQPTAFPTEYIASLPVNHVWPGIFPEFTDRSIYVRVRGQSNYAFQSSDDESDDYRTYTSSIADDMMGDHHRAWQSGSFDLMYQSASSGVHWDGHDLKWGMPRRFRIYAAGALRAAGAVPTTIPKWDNVARASDGSYVDVWSSTGPVTTQARVDDGVDAANFSYHPSAEVLGFSYSDGEELERTELVDDQGSRVAAGRVRLYANSGRPFTSAANEPVYLRGRGGLILQNAADRHDYHAAGQYDHYPVVDVGIPTLTGQLVNPAGDTGETFLADASN